MLKAPDKVVLALAALDPVLAILAVYVVWAPFGYSQSAAPSPGEAGAAVALAGLLAFFLLTALAVTLLVAIVLRLATRPRGTAFFIWPIIALFVAHAIAGWVIVRPFLR